MGDRYYYLLHWAFVFLSLFLSLFLLPEEFACLVSFFFSRESLVDFLWARFLIQSSCISPTRNYFLWTRDRKFRAFPDNIDLSLCRSVFVYMSVELILFLRVSISVSLYVCLYVDLSSSPRVYASLAHPGVFAIDGQKWNRMYELYNDSDGESRRCVVYVRTERDCFFTAYVAVFPCSICFYSTST